MASEKPESYPELVEFVHGALEDEQLRRFVRQSNAIERIEDDQDDAHLRALRVFLACDRPTHHDLTRFVAAVAPKAKMRDRKGRNVFIRLQGGGEYRPPPGALKIRIRLEELIDAVVEGGMEPAEVHAAFESLHPYTDGNGRAGRALWVWHMRKVDLDPFSLTFLHRWYYQSLELSRRALAAP